MDILEGEASVKVNVQKQFAEMIENIEFPGGVYIYETGKVIAFNRLGKNAIQGSGCQNINLLWADHKKLKLPQEVIEGKKEFFVQKEIIVNEELKELDIEINVIENGDEHIVIMFFEQSYKQPFRVDMERLLPRLVWKENGEEYISCNNRAKEDIDSYLKCKDKKETVSLKEQAYIEEYRQMEMQAIKEKVSVCGKVEQMNFLGEESNLVKMNRIPLYLPDGEYQGMLMVYMPILTENDYMNIFGDLTCENAILRECVVDQDILIIGLEEKEGLPLVYATPNVSKLGVTMENVLEKKISWLDIVHPDDRERVTQELKDGLSVKERQIVQKYRICSLEGIEQWVDATTIGREFFSGERFLRVVIRNKSENGLKPPKAQVMMRRETYLDFLTGLPNRLKYEIDAEKQIEIALTNKKKGFVMILELDDFRHVNEAFGTEYGDLLLQRISKALNDIPMVENYCYRVDGDEFLVFIRGEYAKKVEDVIQQCLRLFQTSWKLRDKECFCTVSVGIAQYPKDSVQPKELLKFAEAAVYEAKRKGKNRIRHYKKSVLNSSIERVNYENYLRKAITKGCLEFEVYYQPIVRTSTKEVITAEALVRWYSPELGFISPVNFISLSEYLGLIVPLGEYVLKESFLTCKKWNETWNPDFKVAINLSVVQLVQPNIVERILEIARITGVNTNNIILEVTESLAVEDMVLMKTVLRQLRENGFSIALDDFGTGYSSLNHIMEMPLNYVKIDRSFVSGYGTENFNPSLLSAITELAHSVNMEVVVEGVETKQQMEFLMFLNADKLQGYLYGKPMPANEFETNFFDL